MRTFWAHRRERLGPGIDQDREHNPPVPTGLTEKILIGSLNWKCTEPLASLLDPAAQTFFRTVPYFLSHICFSLCQLHFQAVSSTARDRNVPPQPTETLSLYAVDHLAASVEKECFFPISCSREAPGLALPGQIWAICSSLFRSLCTCAWGG